MSNRITASAYALKHNFTRGTINTRVKAASLQPVGKIKLCSTWHNEYLESDLDKIMVGCKQRQTVAAVPRPVNSKERLDWGLATTFLRTKAVLYRSKPLRFA